jgi:hypothetical protein
MFPSFLRPYFLVPFLHVISVFLFPPFYSFAPYFSHFLLSSFSSFLTFYPFRSSFGFPSSDSLSFLPVLFILLLTLPLRCFFHSIFLFLFHPIHHFITLSIPSSISFPSSFLGAKISFFDSYFLASFSLSVSSIPPPSLSYVLLIHPFSFSSVFTNPSLSFAPRRLPFNAVSDRRVIIPSGLA